MQQRWRTVAGIPWPDLVLAVVLAAAAVLSTAADHAALHPLAEIVAGVAASSIVLRTVDPLVMTAVAVTGIATLALLPDPSTPLWAFAVYLIVAFSIADHVTGIRRIVALIVLLGAGYLIQARDPTSSPIEVALTPVILTAAPALAGWLLSRSRAQALELRELTAQLEASRARVAALSAEAERTRIARDLHDMLGHTLSSIAVQAGAAGELLGADAAAAVPVERIRQAAHDGLDEVRALLAAERAMPSGGPEAIAALVEADGARLSVTGGPVDLSVDAHEASYRIVQEALTNARRHALGAAVEVRLDYRPDELRIVVANDGPFAADSGGGRGLTGIRERAEACGGTASAGRDGDRWVVRARLPLRRFEDGAR